MSYRMMIRLCVAFCACALFAWHAAAQEPWLDHRYQYRLPLTITNTSPHAFSAGEVVTATLPYSLVGRFARADAADIVVTFNGAALPGRALPMGGTTKVLIPLQGELPASGSLSGYTVYFGAPAVTTPPAVPDGVQAWDFKTGSAQGWKSLQDPAFVGSSTSDIHFGADQDGVTNLVLGPDKYHHPVAYAAAATPVADATVYSMLRTTGDAAEASILQRFTTQKLTDNNGASYTTIGNSPAAGFAIDAWGTQMMAFTASLGGPEGTDGRRHPGPSPLYPGGIYAAAYENFQYIVTATQDAPTGASTRVLGKAWQAAPPYRDRFGDPTPAGFQIDRETSDNGAALPAGVPGVMLYGTNVWLRWMVVVPNGFADQVTTVPGTVEAAPAAPAGSAVVQGLVYTAERGPAYPVAKASVNVSDASGASLGSATTDETGRYRLVIPASSTPAEVSVSATAPYQALTQKATLTEGQTVDLDIALPLPATVSGVVTDRNGAPVEGAAVGYVLDNGPFVTTGADGHYTIPAPRGTAVLGAHKDGAFLSGPRWIDTLTGTATADFTLFETGPDILQGRTPVVAGDAGGFDASAIADGDLTTAWTSGPVSGISEDTPLRITFSFVFSKASVGEVDVHWKHFPAAWHIELTNQITDSRGYNLHDEPRTYYSAGETSPAESGGYLAAGTNDRHVVTMKTAPVTGVTQLAIVVTRVDGDEPISLYGVTARAPQVTMLADAAAALRVASGFQPAPGDPNAFIRWNASNEDTRLDMADAIELVRDLGREVKPLRVFVVNYEPRMESQGGLLVRQIYGWNNPVTNTEGHRRDMELASHNYLRITTLPQVTLDEYPIFTNGFRYSDFSYDYAWRSGKYTPGSYDYNALIRQFDLARRVDSGDVDEVWVQGVPGFQMWETSMAGPNGYWCNSNPIPGRNGTRLFIVTGFNYERGLAEMIHDWGHRTESIMGSKVHHAWNASSGSTHWDHFSRYEQIAPGRASCGNDHYPPNANADYEYSNTNFVWSDADDWFNFPNFTGARTYINREAWSGPFPGDYQRSYFNWWFSRMPHIPGATLDPGIREQRLMNWWKYIVDMNAQPESR